ncbi:glycosyltransferase family 2 protein [bacterium]|nr:glycosyltransferase family 2 protein [bacterium]
MQILITTYNSEKYIEKLVSHILNTKINPSLNWEIIIGDDASTDNTIKIIERIKSSSSKVSLITNKQNSGPLVLRKKMLELASSDYIVFIDSDDDFMDGFFDCIVDHIGTDIIVTKRIYQFENYCKEYANNYI